MRILFDRFGRRRFIERLGGTAAAAGAGTAFFGCGSDDDGGGSNTLSLAIWSHFVTSYRPWFENFSSTWAMDNDVDLMIDFVEVADTVTILRDAIAAGAGPDIVALQTAPPSLFQDDVIDLADVWADARAAYGNPVPFADGYTLDPASGKRNGILFGYWAFNGTYRRSLWEAAGFPNGPDTWEDLVTGGQQILADAGQVVGIGLAPQEVDSESTLRAILYSFDGSLQDANGNVTANSPEVIAALEYFKRLYDSAMDTSIEDIFTWDPGSNNVSIREERSSLILNPISAYRAAQRSTPAIADDLFLSPALAGPNGTRLLTADGGAFVVPNYSPNQDLAKQFIRHVMDNLDDQVFNSELFNLPPFAAAAAEAFATGGWLENDPFGSDSRHKALRAPRPERFHRRRGVPGADVDQRLGSD